MVVGLLLAAAKTKRETELERGVENNFVGKLCKLVSLPNCRGDGGGGGTAAAGGGWRLCYSRVLNYMYSRYSAAAGAAADEQAGRRPEQTERV